LTEERRKQLEALAAWAASDAATGAIREAVARAHEDGAALMRMDQIDPEVEKLVYGPVPDGTCARCGRPMEHAPWLCRECSPM